MTLIYFYTFKFQIVRIYSAKIGQPSFDLHSFKVQTQQDHQQCYHHNILPALIRVTVLAQQIQHIIIFLLQTGSSFLSFVAHPPQQLLLAINFSIDVLCLQLNAVKLVNHHIEHLVDFLIVFLEPLQTLDLVFCQVSLLTIASSLRLLLLVLSSYLFEPFEFNASRSSLLTIFDHHL